MCIDLKIDFNHEIIEIFDDENIDRVIWEAWDYYNKHIIVVKTGDALFFSTSPNSGVHLYFKHELVTDSLGKIQGKSISNKSLELFLAYGYLPCADTLYHDIFCVPMGFYLKYDYLGKKFYPIPINLDNIVFSNIRLEDSIKSECQKIFKEINGDIWLALSGGLDSSILFGQLEKIILECKEKDIDLKLMNVYVDGGRDETAYIKILLKNDKDRLKRFHMTEEDAWKALLLHSERDEIFGFPIVLKYEYMMKALGEIGATTLVMGDGPDEAFVCEETYEPYLDHANNVFLPIHKGVVDKGLKSDSFSKIPEKNIWAQYNMIFQGSTNVRFLQTIAESNKIKLFEPFLGHSMQEWCIRHSVEIAKSKEKEALKRYAIGRIPQEIINRKKLGYNSDFAIWNHKGRVFFDELEKRFIDNQVPSALKKFQGNVWECMNRQSGADYDPQKRTGGIGEQAFLFCYLLLVMFCEKHDA